MSLIATGLAELLGREVDQDLVSKAKIILGKLILPKKVTGEVIEKYIRKALRTGAWRNLKPISRALLIVARRFKLIKSPVLKHLLYSIFIEIELYTIKGKALFYGIILAVKNSLTHLIKSINTLLYLGISYLNNPPWYRIYG